MSASVVEIQKYTKELLKTELFSNDVCVNGCQVEGKATVQTMACAVTSSLSVIEEAVQRKVDLLLVHHGLFRKGVDVIVTGTLRKKLQLLLEHGITLLAYHLPLDAHEEVGNNWAVARKLKMHELQPFGAFGPNMIGVKARCEKRPRNDLIQQLEVIYGQKGLHVLAGPEVISSVAIVSGGAHKLVNDAIMQQVDCFITGTNDEPVWHIAREEKINFLSFGHAATEKIGVQLLSEKLSEQFGIQWQFIDEQNPF